MFFRHRKNLFLFCFFEYFFSETFMSHDSHPVMLIFFSTISFIEGNENITTNLARISFHRFLSFLWFVTSNEQQNKAEQEERSDEGCRLLEGVCRTETVVRGQVQLLAFRVAVVPGLDVALAPNSQSLQFFLLFLLFLFYVVRNDHVA